jgi:hypothetical protein
MRRKDVFTWTDKGLNCFHEITDCIPVRIKWKAYNSIHKGPIGPCLYGYRQIKENLLKYFSKWTIIHSPGTARIMPYILVTPIHSEIRLKIPNTELGSRNSYCLSKSNPSSFLSHLILYICRRRTDNGLTKFRFVISIIIGSPLKIPVLRYISSSQ